MALGGTSPYTYSWSNGQNSSKATNLVSGNYYYTISDSKSCSITNSVNIPILGKSSLSGVAKFSNGFISKSDAEVTILNASSQPYKEIAKVDIGENGTFAFNNLSNGIYVLNVKLYNHAQQKYPGVMQTYYNYTHRWQDAQLIGINCETVNSIVVEMFENPSSENGKGVISGNINYALNGNKSIMGEPVPGAEISVEQEPDDMPIMQTSSKEDGSYIFTDVPAGVYSLNIDIPGVPQISTHSIILSENESIYEDLNFIVDTGATNLGISTDSLTSVPLILSENLQIQIYPNPASEYLYVDFSSEKNNDVLLELIDINGKVLQSQKIVNISSKNSIKLNLEKLDPANYFVKFESGKNMYIKKIVVVR